MSLTLYVCAINLDKLASIEGSKNEELLQRILQDDQARIAAHDDYFRAAIQKDTYLTLDAAVTHIINGRIDDSATPLFQYEHAATLIADSLGQQLNTENVEDINPVLLDDVDSLIEKKLCRAGLPASSWPTLCEILERGPFIKAPMDEDMRPGAGYLTALEVKEAFRTAEGIDLNNADNINISDLTWPEDALQIAQDYRSWLEEAARNNLGLFFHY